MAQTDHRLLYKRRRVIFKRDYNREIEEVNRIIKLTCTIENVEQLEAVRISILKTKKDLEDMYLGLLETIDEDDDEDKKFEEDILKERDNYYLNMDRAIGLCQAFRIKLEGQSKRESLNASIANTTSSNPARLPKINVPKFNGDLRKFLDFKALFENLVHNDDDIPPVRKMHYLKESLVEEASKALANISVSDEGYKEAWSRVLAKYDNRRIIIHTHFNDLFCAERIRNESNLRQLLDKVDVALRGLRACGEVTDRWSSILAYMLYIRLDPKTRSDFDNTVTSNSTYFQFKELQKFCETRAGNVEARKLEELPSSSSTTPVNTSRPLEVRKTFVTSRSSCVVCQGQHLLIDCATFAAKSPTERLQLIQNSKLCINCFSRNHSVQGCPSVKSCKLCQQRHHYLLHVGETPAYNSPGAQSTINTTTNASLQVQTSTKRFIVLPSAKVRFSCGRVIGNARILLDNCSQPTLLSDVLVKRWKLPTFKNPSAQPVRGVGFESVGTPRSCKLRLASRVNDFSIDIEADVIPGSAIPYSVKALQWDDHCKSVSKYPLADTAFYSKNPVIAGVDLILGAQYVEKCLLNETVNVDSLVLRNSQFGWTLNGEFPANQANASLASNSCCFTTETIDRQLAEFLEFESEADGSVSHANFCEQHFVEHVQRNKNGQFVVRLPFLLSPELLGSNRHKAIAILNRGCRTDTELWSGYTAFMNEYERMQHMTLIQPDNSTKYVIPHHAVIRPESTTTKIRVVFNASSPSSSGYSLNDLLAVGPQLQPQLFEALVRFRTYPVAFSADVAMMYRCIFVHEADRKYQQIVWRSSPIEPVKTYQLNTVTYGTAPASFLATRCLHELAYNIQTDDPNTAEAIRTHFYMDDLMTGASTVEEAQRLQMAIHQTLASAGLKLRKYQSNSPSLLQSIPTELVQPIPTSTLGTTHDRSSVILGLGWNRDNDTFYVRVSESKLKFNSVITKRQLLSEVSRVFDPLGILSPFTIRAKLFVQRVWSEPIKWDDFISKQLSEDLCKYLSELPELARLAIDRTYNRDNLEPMELCGFCDASKRAYCAVIYSKCTSSQGTDQYRFVCAKTRLAPTKSSVTIPRLELQAAKLLVNLMNKVLAVLPADFEQVKLFSDSQVVLAWLAKPDNNWTVYVRNRVQSITSSYPAKKWQYIPTEHNPADVATRGLRAADLINSDLWLQGPLRWKLPHHQQQTKADTNLVNVEILPSEPSFSYTVSRGGINGSFIDRFESYTRLLGVLGRVILFTRKWKLTRPNQAKYLCPTVSYLLRARSAAILLLQVHAFPKEREMLQNGQPVHSGSAIFKLEPFLDQDGIIRARGRLENSAFSFQKRHPIVIPKGSHFMKLYVRHLHQSYCHASKSFIMSFVLAEFWVYGGLHALVKATIHACLVCARYRAATYSQIMGQLPMERVTPSRPFANVGIDFCGPFNSKCVGHRSVKINKIYACIYVCLATRAIHIEVVTNLTTTHFLMSLHRFVARRGLPRSIYSDCGTNFIGARNYLNLADPVIQHDAVTHSIQWNFNPPRAPHRGGIWESAVKCAKSHLYRTIGSQTLNLEEYVTLLTRIEAILNSRPLCYRSTPQAGEFVLTPSHFLIGTLTYIVPEPETCNLPLWRRYDLLRILLQSFWKTWRSDYLNMLQKKEKWNTPSPNIEIGQLVLLKTEASPGSWPSATVQEIHPDPCGTVRKVTVKLASGAKLLRDIRHLVKLPIDALGTPTTLGGSVDTSATTQK